MNLTTIKYIEELDLAVSVASDELDSVLLAEFPVGSVVYFRYNDNQKTVSAGTLKYIRNGELFVEKSKIHVRGKRGIKRVHWRNVLACSLLVMKEAAK